MTRSRDLLRAGRTDEEPQVELTLEGSLRHLEAQIHFRYTQPDVGNSVRETEAIAELVGCGFTEENGKAVLRGEDAIMRFFSTGLPRLRQKWQVKEGERFRHVTRDFVRLEPQFAIRDQSDGWLDFHVHYTAGREAVFSSADVNRLLQTGRGHVRLKDGKMAVVDSELVSDLEEVLRDCDPAAGGRRARIPHLQREYLKASIASWKGREASNQALL